MTTTLGPQSLRLMQLLHVEGMPVRDDQYVLVSNDAMKVASIVGVRKKDEDPFTGWHIVAASEHLEAAEYGYYSVKELAAERPAWVMPLALPVGWAFRFVENMLVDCVSPDGVTHNLHLEVNVQ